MKSYPRIPALDAAPDALLDGGHLWLLEKIDGYQLRFQVDASGYIQFADRERRFADPDAIPWPYRCATRHVRTRFDRTAFREAVDDPTAVTFFGIATIHRSIPYDWDRIPPVLGFGIYSEKAGTFLTPDRVNAIFDRLGLDPVNSIARELPARDVDPTDIDVPMSTWYDGRAAGVIIEDKRGHRAQGVQTSDSPGSLTDQAPVSGTDPAVAIDRLLTDGRRSRLTDAVRTVAGSVSFDALFETFLAEFARRHPSMVGGINSTTVPPKIRDAIAERTADHLDSMAR